MLSRGIPVLEELSLRATFVLLDKAMRINDEIMVHSYRDFRNQL